MIRAEITAPPFTLPNNFGTKLESRRANKDKSKHTPQSASTACDFWTFLRSDWVCADRVAQGAHWWVPFPTFPACLRCCFSLTFAHLLLSLFAGVLLKMPGIEAGRGKVDIHKFRAKKANVIAASFRQTESLGAMGQKRGGRHTGGAKGLKAAHGDNERLGQTWGSY